MRTKGLHGSFRLAEADGISIREFIRSNTLLKIAQIIVFIGITLPAFVSVANFLGAVTPAEAIAIHHQPLPQGWTAGVMSHGHYYRWWTISERPILFGLSALALVIGVLFLWSSLAWLWWKERGSQPPPEKTNKTDDGTKKKTEDAQ